MTKCHLALIIQTKVFIIQRRSLKSNEGVKQNTPIIDRLIHKYYKQDKMDAY